MVIDNNEMLEYERLVSYGYISNSESNKANYTEIIRKERSNAATRPDWAVEYASSIIKGRFCQAELLISQDPHWALVYAANVIGDRWEEAEKTIIQEGNLDIIWDYLTSLVKAKWSEAEPIFLKSKTLKDYQDYLEWLKKKDGTLFSIPFSGEKVNLST
jgi:hypothetical protein